MRGRLCFEFTGDRKDSGVSMGGFGVAGGLLVVGACIAWGRRRRGMWLSGMWLAQLPERNPSTRPKAPHIDGGGTQKQGSIAAVGSMVVSSPPRRVPSCSALVVLHGTDYLCGAEHSEDASK